MKKRWSSEEVLTLKKIISDNPGNLAKCFLIASKELNRSKDAIKYQWYTKYSLESPVFVTMSSNTILKNRKNSNVVEKLKIKSRWKILPIFFDL